MQDKKTSTVKSADRVLDLIELLSQPNQKLSHSDISGILGIPKGSLTQLLKNLTEREYVAFSSADRRYVPGRALLELASLMLRSRSLLECAGPVIASIVETTGETSALNVRNGDRSEVVITQFGLNRLTAQMRLGDEAPLYATSGGKIILAFMPQTEFDAYLRAVKFETITVNTIDNADELRLQVENARGDLIAYSHQEFTAGIIGIAVPVLTRDKIFLGALNVAIPSIRYSETLKIKSIEALRRGAASIGKQLVGPVKV